MSLFGAAYAAPNKNTTFLYYFLILVSSNISELEMYECIVVIEFQNVAKLLYESRELVKSQQFVIDDLKQKLNDAQGDIKVS